VGDLDLDGVPEVLCTFFEFDVAALYVFKADGTSYLPRAGRPVGEALTEPVTFGTPSVANLLGDEHPEIIIRSGYLLPGTGPERVYIFDYLLQPVPDWPQPTPARPNQAFATQYAPMVDDIDADGRVELIMLSDANELLVWNFQADFKNGANSAKFLVDERNSNVFLSPNIVTDAESDQPDNLPTVFALEQNYPNPFNPASTIEFSVPRRSHLQLQVFNILGQRVAVLADGEFSAGTYSVTFDASGFSSGMYFYRLVAGEKVLNRKMTLLK
jgi:hypothetical protein